MENHRLKPMVDGYDVKVFNQLYKNTERLRKKLAFEIDPRRFGVDYKLILSWFDDKFIYAFNRYYETKDPETLKGYIINSLKTFKYRILKEAYAPKNLQYRNAIDITSDDYFEHLIHEPKFEEDSEESALLQIARDFIRTHISDDAYLIFEIQLCPPIYILDRIDSESKRARNNLPNDVIADYLGLPICEKVLNYIQELKREINQAISEARDYFQTKQIEELIS